MPSKTLSIIAIFEYNLFDENKDIKVKPEWIENGKFKFYFPPIDGSFDCSYNQLTTLEGAPNYVGGNFYCDNNELPTLEGAPEYVGGYFGCSYNELETLEGAPKHVSGYFSCSGNKLKTLEGAPEYVGGDFVCFDNPKLKNTTKPVGVKGKFYA